MVLLMLNWSQVDVLSQPALFPLFLGCEHEGGQFWIFEYSFEK